MKRLFSSLAVVLIAKYAIGGGILTNTSQSAQYVRMLSRGASTQIDAVYYNPAGLIKMENGLHVSVNNQSLFQKSTVTTTKALNNKEFIGDGTVPFFPSGFAVYKIDNFAFSFGFGQISGGITTTYDKGLPSFEELIVSESSKFGNNLSGYNVDIQFKNQSSFWGLQPGVSAKINKYISGYLGARYIPSVNSYTGSIRNIALYFPQAAELNNQVIELDDIEVDTRQTGKGITPLIAGINISPVEKFNIGIKYEYKTFLTLTNDAKRSDLGLDFLEDGKKNPRDIPGLLTIGADYKFTGQFSASLTFNDYFDKLMLWGKNIYGQEMTIDHNSWELALGLQFEVSDNFAFSFGAMHSETGTSNQFQSDFMYVNSGETGALGFQYKITDKIVLDAGMLYSFYKDINKHLINFDETYSRDNMGFAIGIGYKIF